MNDITQSIQASVIAQQQSTNNNGVFLISSPVSINNFLLHFTPASDSCSSVLKFSKNIKDVANFVKAFNSFGLTFVLKTVYATNYYGSSSELKDYFQKIQLDLSVSLYIHDPNSNALKLQSPLISFFDDPLLGQNQNQFPLSRITRLDFTDNDINSDLDVEIGFFISVKCDGSSDLLKESKFYFEMEILSLTEGGNEQMSDDVTSFTQSFEFTLRHAFDDDEGNADDHMVDILVPAIVTPVVCVATICVGVGVACYKWCKWKRHRDKAINTQWGYW